MNALADTFARTRDPLVAAYFPVTRKPTSIFEFATRCQGSDGSTSTLWGKAAWDFEGWATQKVFGLDRNQPPTPDLSPPATADEVARLNLYEPITWHFMDQPQGTVNGALVPLGDSRNLIDAFFNGAPIIAGLLTEQGGHVVIVHRINVAVVQTEPQSVERHPSGFIDWVEVTDSQTPEKPLQIIPGDKFLRDARFIFAIYQDIRK
jgi:hypothetical protein